MNTGNTRPFAHPRSLATFSHLSEYPFEDRLRLGSYYTIVELAVEGGVKNVEEYLIRASEMKCSACEKFGEHQITTTKLLYDDGGDSTLARGGTDPIN